MNIINPENIRGKYIVISLLVIAFFIVGTANVATDNNYDADIIYGSRTDVSRVDYYILSVYPNANGDMRVIIDMQYTVLDGYKTYGYKQFGLPKAGSYIDNVEVSDEFGELKTGIVDNGRFVEIGWMFSRDIELNEKRTLHIEFDFFNSIIETNDGNRISLPNSFRFSIEVLQKTYKIHLPEGESFISTAGMNYDGTDLKHSFSYLDVNEPGTVIITKLYSRDANIGFLFGITIILFILIIVATIVYNQRKDDNDELRFDMIPPAYFLYLNRGKRHAFFASVFEKYILFGADIEEDISEMQSDESNNKTIKTDDYNNIKVTDIEKSNFDYAEYQAHQKMVFASEFNNLNSIRPTFEKQLENDMKFLFKANYIPVLLVVPAFIIGLLNKDLLSYERFYGISAIFLFAFVYPFSSVLSPYGRLINGLVDREVFLNYLNRDTLIYLPVFGYDNSVLLPSQIRKSDIAIVKKAYRIVGILIKKSIKVTNYRGILTYAVVSAGGSSGGCGGCGGCSGCGGCGGCGG